MRYQWKDGIATPYKGPTEKQIRARSYNNTLGSLSGMISMLNWRQNELVGGTNSIHAKFHHLREHITELDEMLRDHHKELIAREKAWEEKHPGTDPPIDWND